MRIRSHTMSTLRRYLLENNVNMKVAMLVQRQAAARFNDMAMLTAKDVPALATLATGIRQRLHGEICQPHLQKHQLFHLWLHIDSQWFQQFCSRAVDLKFLRPEDDLFHPGGESVAYYFIISGSMDYTQVPESSPVDQETNVDVGHNEWLCESTLWVHWIHVGKAEAVTKCQVLAIEIDGFAAAINEHFTVGPVAAAYGRSFAERVVSSRPPHLPWPDDLQVPFTKYRDVVVALPAELHVLIGSLALEHCKSGFVRSWKNKPSQNKMRQEVQDGRSILILDQAGEMERVVSVVVLHLSRGDGRVLVQVAKWENNQSVPDMQLPAAKCRRNESSDEALQRLINTDLTPLAPAIDIQHMERATAEQDSARFGVRTTYCRKKFFANFDEAICALNTVSRPSLMSSGPMRPNGSSQFMGSTSADHLELLTDEPVHFIPHEKGGGFHVWVLEGDLQRLKILKDCAVVRRWVSGLRPFDVPQSDAQVDQVHHTSV